MPLTKIVVPMRGKDDKVVGKCPGMNMHVHNTCYRTSMFVIEFRNMTIYTSKLECLGIDLRPMPILLPHQLLPWLVENGICPTTSETYEEIAAFWAHLRARGVPTHGASDQHIPLYIWGDDAQFTKAHQDKAVVVAMGCVLSSESDAMAAVWPLLMYQQASQVQISFKFR